MWWERERGRRINYFSQLFFFSTLAIFLKDSIRARARAIKFYYLRKCKHEIAYIKQEEEKKNWNKNEDILRRKISIVSSRCWKWNENYRKKKKKKKLMRKLVHRKFETSFVRARSKRGTSLSERCASSARTSDPGELIRDAVVAGSHRRLQIDARSRAEDRPDRSKCYKSRSLRASASSTLLRNNGDIGSTAMRN